MDAAALQAQHDRERHPHGAVGEHAGDGSPGVRRSEMVHTVDILPTLMDMAGLEIPADLQGQSLKPLLEAPGAAPVAGWRQYIFGSNYQASSTRTRVTSRYVRTQDGFIYYPEKKALYNLNEYPDINLGKDIKSPLNLITNPQMRRSWPT